MQHRKWLTLSYERLRAELDEIVEQYRVHHTDDCSTATREAAIRRIRKLGFTEGDALRWLRLKPLSRRSSE